jgi:phage terminase small subunit
MKTLEQLPLTPKQQRFCDEYLTDMNATRAALAAGYSRSTAMNGQLMGLPKIVAYIKKHQLTARESILLDHRLLLDQLGRIAFASMGDYFDADGNMRPINELGEDEKAAIWSISVTESKDGTKTTKIKLHNKMSAMEKIAKHIHFYKMEQWPKTEYMYFDKEELDEHDRFEDESIDPAAETEPQDKPQHEQAAPAEMDLDAAPVAKVEPVHKPEPQPANLKEPEPLPVKKETGVKDKGDDLGSEKQAMNSEHHEAKDTVETKPMGKWKMRRMRKLGYL